MTPTRARILSVLARSEALLREVAPQQADSLHDLILEARALPALAPPALPLIIPVSELASVTYLERIPEPAPAPLPPLRKFVRPKVQAEAPKAAQAPAKAPRARLETPPPPKPAARPAAEPIRRKHLTLVQPPPAVVEEPVEARKPIPPDPMGEKMREAEGARALLLEIVRRAAYDWVLYRGSTRLDQKALAEDAYMWLFVEDEEHPHWKVREEDEKEITGFVAICDALDLDVERVRSYIRKLTPNRVMSSGRPPENSRASDHAPHITLHTKVSDSGGDSGGGVDFDALITQMMDFDG